jgi:hypothetical protein
VIKGANVQRCTGAIVGISLSLIVVYALGHASIACAADGGNLLANADLAIVKDGWPARWRRFILDGCAARFRWSSPAGGSPEFMITNSDPVEAGVKQTLYLRPGWYRASADIRTEKVGARGRGAYLCIRAATTHHSVEVASPDLRGTTGWRTVGFYFKAGPLSAELNFVCQLGDEDRNNTGTAWFRNIKLVRLEELPPRQRGFDLDRFWGPDLRRLAIDRQFETWLITYPRGSRWSALAVFASLIAVAACGWRSLSLMDRREDSRLRSGLRDE